MLTDLLSPAFEAAVSAGTPRALRSRLESHPIVASLQKSYQQGELTPEQLRRFVGELLEEHRNSEAFPYEIALAAISVVLEVFHDNFSDEYLIDLARLKVRGFEVSRRVAALSLERKQATPQNHNKNFGTLSDVALIVFKGVREDSPAQPI